MVYCTTVFTVLVRAIGLATTTAVWTAQLSGDGAHGQPRGRRRAIRLICSAVGVRLALLKVRL